jgi:Zn-dependent M16 (insulinase) family peptidase
MLSRLLRRCLLSRNAPRQLGSGCSLKHFSPIRRFRSNKFADAVIYPCSWSPKTQSIRSYCTKSAEMAASSAALVSQAVLATDTFLPTNLKRGEERDKLNLNVNDQVHGYIVKKKRFIEERNFTVYELEHLATGAKHLHIECDDTNNVFCTAFRTTPHDSTGVAHILEHTVLCGSEKYPVRDPFFNMLKRSLNTYMNAWTSDDYTSYPFATENPKDYYNLLSVYLDAIYFPKLDEYDFMQEGHRLEVNQDTNGSNVSLQIKGVVYNEMKGELSDPANYFTESLRKHLYPSHFNSGGDPKEIPQLTWEKLKEFHQRHYHPSNSYTFTYGDLPLDCHLKFINENVFRRFGSLKCDDKTPAEVRFSHPKFIKITGPPSTLDTPNKQSKFAVSYLTNKIEDGAFESFALSMLSALLLDGPNAPMYQALIEPQIGTVYSPGTGYEPHSKREAPFSIGLSGIKTEDAPKVEEIITKTLQKVATEGFPQQRIDALLHQHELDQKHVSTDLGISLASSLINVWIHGGDPVETLSINTLVKQITEEIAKGPFFQNKVRQWLLNNPHKVSLLMESDLEFAKKEAAAEEARLDEIKKQLTAEQITRLREQSQRLALRQQQPQDPSCLPKLTLNDIERVKPRTLIYTTFLNGVKVQLCKQPTNGISYFNVLLNFEHIPPHLNIYVPLFCSVLTEMGAGATSYRDFSQKIELTVGGFSASPSLKVDLSDISKYQRRILLSSYALERNLEKMYRLWTELFNNKPNFSDKERLKTLVRNALASMDEAISSSGHAFARSFAASFQSPPLYIVEVWNGITQYNFLQTVAAQLEEDPQSVISALQEIANLVLNRNVMSVAVNTESRLLDANAKLLDSMFLNLPFLSEAQTKPVQEIIDWETRLKNVRGKRQFYFTLPSTSVNFSSLVLPTKVPWTHPDSAKLTVLAQLIAQNYLHREVREKGGAYGSDAGHDYFGVFHFTSFRDPAILPTLAKFRNAVKWVTKENITDSALEESKLSIFAVVDAPLSPSQKGMAEFLTGVTHEMRQKRREELLSVTRKDVLDVCEAHLSTLDLEKTMRRKRGEPLGAVAAVFGSEEGENEIRNDSKNLNKWVLIQNLQHKLIQ